MNSPFATQPAAPAPSSWACILVLDDLQARANHALGKEETPYERRRRIIGDQLYGVDVMDWAVHIAELRLWLQLVVETNLHPAELQFRPLLPNLSFNIRCGDSLLQTVADIDFSPSHQPPDLPTSLKGKITQLKAKKRRFYQGDQNEPSLTEKISNAKKLTSFARFCSTK